MSGGRWWQIKFRVYIGVIWVSNGFSGDLEHAYACPEAGGNSLPSGAEFFAGDSGRGGD